MKETIIITRGWLVDHGACSDQLDLFGRLYPDGVRLTRRALADAAAGGLHITWLVDRLHMKTSLRAEYECREAALWVEYRHQIAPLRAKYEAQKAALWAELRQKAKLWPKIQTDPRIEYERQLLSAALWETLWAKYERQEALLWAGYQRQVDPLDVEYEKQLAPIVADALGLVG